MSGIRLIMFLVMLPVLAALAHDGWLFYQHQERGFMLSALGFLWTTYHPDSFRFVQDGLDPQTWGRVNFVLQQKAVYVALAFAMAVYAVIALLGMLRMLPGAGGLKGEKTAKNRIDQIVGSNRVRRR